MNTAAPPVISPYIKQSLGNPSLTLLTSVLSTPANWLLIRFLAAALNDGGQPRQSQNQDNAIRDSAVTNVTFVSIWRSLNLWQDLARKIGLDLTAAIRSSNLIYIDGLSTEDSTVTRAGALNLTDLTLKSLIATFNKARSTSARSHPSQRNVLVLDGLDFLQAVDPQATQLDIEAFLLEMQDRFTNVILTFSADSALLHNPEATATPLEVAHSNLARNLAYGSNWVYQLRPLETGQSKEVNGSLRISRGGTSTEQEVQGSLEEGEWLYLLNIDGSVKIWSRSEA